MFREMRNKKREVFKEDIEDILKRGEYGILSVMGDNGYPYAVPLSYVYFDNCIYFHSATEGYKLDNIKADNKVSFCVVVDTELMPEKFSTKYKSVIAFGTANNVEGDLKKTVLTELVKKYSRDFLSEGEKYIDRAKDKVKIIKIEIQHATGKARI